MQTIYYHTMQNVHSETMDNNKTTHNSTYPKGGDSCSKDSFVVNQTLVFKIKFCGKSPALRVAAKRYQQAQTDIRASIGLTSKRPNF